MSKRSDYLRAFGGCLLMLIPVAYIVFWVLAVWAMLKIIGCL